MAKPRTEIEVKFDVAAPSAASLERLLRKRAGRAPVRESLTSVYFDTPRHALYRKGVTLRVRRLGRKYTQTVKSATASGGVLKRAEWERPVARFAPDLPEARKTGLRALIELGARARLVPVFRIVVRRSRYAITAGRSRIEVAVDDGRALAGGRQRRFHELELELTGGAAAGLFALAKSLSSRGDLELSLTTKAARGYELIGETADSPVTGGDLILSSKIAASLAFQRIVQRCFQRMARNRVAAIAGDPDAVHEMRIAIRQLRVALEVFSDVLRTRESQSLKKELRWINAELGRARDIDVFFQDVIEPWARRHRRRAPVSDVYRAFERRRGELHAQAAAGLRSPRFTCLLLDVMRYASGFYEQGVKTGGAAGRSNTRIARYAAIELRRRRAKFVKIGRRLRSLSETDRHQLRIRGKKLRYAIEFFEDVYPGKKHRKRHHIAVRALKQLQNALGELHDVAQQRALARSYLQRSGAGSSVAVIGSTTRVSPARCHRLLDKAVKAYKEFATVKPFWI